MNICEKIDDIKREIKKQSTDEKYITGINDFSRIDMFNNTTYCFEIFVSRLMDNEKRLYMTKIITLDIEGEKIKHNYKKAKNELITEIKNKLVNL